MNTKSRRSLPPPGSKRSSWFDRVANYWHSHPAEAAFLLIATVFGLLFVFVIPPTQAADETTHFHRAYQISQGQILSDRIEVGYGAQLPRAVSETSQQLFGNIPSHYDRQFNYGQLPHLLKVKVNNNDKVPVHLEGSTVYSPVPYIPQVLAITFAKITWPSPLLMYYLARLANLVVWIALMYLAIRIWPYSKWPIFALALIPMSLSQGATASPDALTNSLAFLGISGVLYWAKRGTRLSNREITLAFVVIVALALCKPVFFVLAPLALLLNRKQLGSQRRFWLLAGGLLLAALAATAIWNGLVSDYSVAIQHYYYPAPNVDKAHQLAYIIKHPLGFAHTLAITYASSAGDLFVRTFAGRLGWWDVDLPLWLIMSIYTLLTLAIINREPKSETFKLFQRLLAGAIFVAAVVVTSATLYLTLTSVGVHYIVGMQGRYFIAFSPLLAVAFGGLLKVENWQPIARWLFPVSFALILLSSLIITFNRFV